MFKRLLQPTYRRIRERRYLRELVQYPLVLRPGQTLPTNEEGSVMALQLAKENLARYDDIDIYKENEGDIIFRNIVNSPEGDEEMSTHLRNLNEHGVSLGAFRIWANFSALFREALLVRSQFPVFAMMQTLQDKGVSKDDSTREALKSFPVFTRQVNQIDVDDIDDALPAEVLPIVTMHFTSFSDGSLLAHHFDQTIENFPSMNAWIRYEILKLYDV